MSTSAPSAGPVASIIIPTHNQWAYTIRCLLALAEETRDVPHEVIVVDNGSTDETARALPQLEGIRCRLGAANLGFARACNQGAAMARGRYLVFLNNDTEPRRGWLSRLLAPAEADRKIAIAGSKLLFADGTIQSAGLLLAYGLPYPLSIVPRHYRRPDAQAPPSGEVRAVTGACMLVRAEVFAAAGGFDEGFTNGYEDVDLCLQVGELGHRVAYVADSVVTHHEAVSGGRFKNEAANLDRLQSKWLEKLDQLPFDVDYRRRAPHAPPGPRRAGASVVVIAEDAIATITPCIENLVRTLGPGDELLIVDGGSKGASAAILEHLARRHAGVARLLPARGVAGFAAAARLAIAAASHELCALVGPNVKVSAGWLDKLAAHLDRDPTFGAVSASWTGRTGDDGPLYAPPEAYAPPGSSVLDKLVTAGPRPARVAASACLMARRAIMTELGGDARAPLGGAPTAIADCLAAGGRKLVTASDVFVRRLDQVGGDHHGPDRARYLELQARPAAHGSPSISVVIPVRDNLALTRDCVASVYRWSPPGLQLVLIDNGSSEDVAGLAEEMRRAHGDVVYRRNDVNQGFAYACNQGIAAAAGEVLVLLNNDVVVTPGWLTRQIALLDTDPAIALCGPATNATSGPQLVGTATYRGAAEAVGFAERWARDHAGEMAIVPRITGLCMVMRRRLVEEVGGFDTIFGFGNYEDDDLCVRVRRAGHEIAIAYDVFIHHHGSATFKSLDLDTRALCDENWEIFCEKWRHPRSAAGLDALGALGRAAPFDPAVDRVPVDYAQVFNRAVEPLPLDTRKPVRVLCVPDWRAPASFRPALERFFATFTSADPVALVARVEPPSPAMASRAVAALTSLLDDLGIALDAAPDIVVEVTPLPPARRGSLYTAASAYLGCGGARDRFYRREAVACGLTIAELPEAASAPAPAPGPPLVSVIVPTRNRPQLLEVALRSVLAQTFQDFEIIVVNDAGTPVAGAIERLGADTGRKIRCVENASRRGHGATRNAGLRVARGRYVAYLDDDDSYRPEHLATLLGALADGAHQVAYSDAARAHVAPAGGGAGMVVVKRDVPYSTDFDPDAILLCNFIPIVCVMHERACAGEGPLFDETLPVLEDWDVWIRLSRRHRFVHVPRVTCEFTVRTDGSSVTTERLGLFAETEKVIRQRYSGEIAASPRASEALRRSLGEARG